ncbi:MAG: hypothetical protein ACRCW7_01420, partial [Cetobacterium sp.]
VPLKFLEQNEYFLLILDFHLKIVFFPFQPPKIRYHSIQLRVGYKARDFFESNSSVYMNNRK